jgi:hypothetical protein
MTSKHFASKFKPKFRACDLALFCMNNSETQELKFLLKYWPFRRYMPKKSSELFTVTELKEKDHEMIKKEWQNQIKINTDLKFDDKIVLDKVNQSLKRDFDAQLLDKDEDSNETEFIRHCDLSKLESKEAKFLKFDYDLESIKKVKEQKLEKFKAYKSLAKTTIHCERGIQLEQAIIVKINAELGFNFVQDKELKIRDYENFFICGLVDGIDRERNSIIEVKTRFFIDKNKKPSMIQLREKLQCLSYMSLTESKLCFLVESDSRGEQNVIKIEWDEDEFEAECLNKLREFVEKYKTISEIDFCRIISKYKYDEIFS